MVQKWEAWRSNDGKRDVHVDDVKDGRVQFRRIYRWNFGWPQMDGIPESTTIGLFEANYTRLDVQEV